MNVSNLITILQKQKSCLPLIAITEEEKRFTIDTVVETEDEVLLEILEIVEEEDTY